MNRRVAFGVGALGLIGLGAAYFCKTKPMTGAKVGAVAHWSGATPQAAGVNPSVRTEAPGTKAASVARAPKAATRTSERARRRAIADKLRQQLAALYGNQPDK